MLRYSKHSARDKNTGDVMLRHSKHSAQGKTGGGSAMLRHSKHSERGYNLNYMKQYFVYILLCADNSYYTGITNDIERRLREHQSGTDQKSYTYKRRPLKLVFHEMFKEVDQAIAFEKQVKGWSRAKKEAIINRTWEQLPDLAKRRT